MASEKVAATTESNQPSHSLEQELDQLAERLAYIFRVKVVLR